MFLNVPSKLKKYIFYYNKCLLKYFDKLTFTVVVSHFFQNNFEYDVNFILVLIK